MRNIMTWLPTTALGVAALVFAGTVAHATVPDVASIQPVPGLVITSTVGETVVANDRGGTHAYSGMDFEEWYSVASADADAIDYQFRVSAPSDVRATRDMAGYVLERSVRRSDIAQATRINLFWSSLDPRMFAGQTFVETSVKALGLLESGAEVPFVIGVNDGDDPLGGIGALLQHAALASFGGKAQSSPLAGIAGAFANNSARTYYRGSLRRMDSAPVMLPVLLNGARVDLPAIHAQGTLVNGDKSMHIQFWWLASKTWPLTLKWNLAIGDRKANWQVTKIDLQPGAGNDSSHTGGVASAMAAALRKSCQLELSGLYFNTGSAVLLPESQPALRRIAQVVAQSKLPRLEVQGHTDNIGTVQFNLGLSQQRAEAIRQALVAQFGIPAGKLVAKGYGFARPVESNTTVAGRARNRRVELACATAP